MSSAPSAVPILPALDLDRSAAYYGYLGFKVIDQVDDYLRVAQDGIELHLYRDADLDPLRNPAGCYLRVADPEHLRSRWNSDGVECLDVPAPEHYGRTSFAVIDPNGNTLRVGPAAEL